MKSLAKKIVVSKLADKVLKLRSKNKFKIIAVAGSVGKTSTKFAIASLLGQKYKVQFQTGNYNDIVSVPLIFFGIQMPSLTNPLAWAKVFSTINKQLKKPYPFDIVVVELGTDGPGQIQKFAKYIDADLTVVTAIAPEHMEYFGDLSAVAREEMSVASFSKLLLINNDLCASEHVGQVKRPYKTYSIKKSADYRLTDLKYTPAGYDFVIYKQDQKLLSASHETIAETQLYSIAAAAAVADIFGIEPDLIDKGIRSIKPVDGRMQKLAGVNGSVIYDDTYNASPIATLAALDTIYKVNAPQKIAILGNMNELGAYSEQAHKEVGEHCDPTQLELVVTIGTDANMHLAPAAQKRGCNVKTFTDPYSAGKYLMPLVKNSAVILAKGSQNGVFAEEAVKILLADQADQNKLVRQSAHWLGIKKKAFKQ